MPPRVAYLSKGKIHVWTSEGPAREIESRFGQAVRDRAVRASQRHSWKTSGRGARFMSGGMAWGLPERDPAAMRVAVTGLTRGREPNRLVYALETDEVAGVFALDVASGEEQRLVHGNERVLRHPCASSEVELIACSMPREGGTSNLAVMRADGSEQLEVTEGESLDLAPAWVPGQPQLVFQSAGIGRDREGVFTGYGPFAIQRVDLKSGEMTTLAEDPTRDHLGPRVARDGTLYFIRRPWRSPATVSPWRIALDVLLLPFRLLLAVFQWLNFFTMAYTGKPLSSAGNARQKSADMKQMMIWGNLVDAEKESRRSRGDDAPALVPPSWQLVRMRPGAGAEVLAKGVLSFDLCEDGSVLYSNGSAVFHLAPGTDAQRLFKDEQIEQVAALR